MTPVDKIAGAQEHDSSFDMVQNQKVIFFYTVKATVLYATWNYST